ncbi:unnamed protein product [Calypogeia fissa]
MVDAKLILGLVGNCIAVLMFLSPTPTFWNIVKNKSTQHFSGLPYVVTLFNCLLWVLYGTPMVIKGGMLILTINGAGVGIEIIFISLFLIYADRKNRAKVVRLLAAVVLTFITIASITLLAVKSQNVRKLEVGSICVIVTVAMYVAPLSVMKMVITTKSVAFMPFFLSLFIFLNSAVWTGYGVFSKDIFIMIPNGVGAIFGIAQLSLHAIYGCNSAPIDIEAVPPMKTVTKPYATKPSRTADDDHV